MSDSGSSSTPPFNPYSSSGQDKRFQGLSKALASVDLDGHDFPPSPAPSTPRNGRQYAIATELVYTNSGDQYNASSMPIYQVRKHLSTCPAAVETDGF